MPSRVWCAINLICIPSGPNFMAYVFMSNKCIDYLTYAHWFRLSSILYDSRACGQPYAYTSSLDEQKSLLPHAMQPLCACKNALSSRCAILFFPLEHCFTRFSRNHQAHKGCIAGQVPLLLFASWIDMFRIFALYRILEAFSILLFERMLLCMLNNAWNCCMSSLFSFACLDHSVQTYVRVT